MASRTELNGYEVSRSEYSFVNPKGLTIDWRKNVSRQGQRPPVDDDLRRLAISMISPGHPAATPASVGQLNPVTCRTVRGGGSSKVELLGGFTRAAAALWLVEGDDGQGGLVPDFRIKYITSTMSDAEAALANVVENLERKELTPIQIAKAARSLHEGYGWPLEDIAAKLGRGMRYLENVMQVLTLPEQIVTSIDAGETPLTAGLEMVKLDDQQEAIALFNAAANKGEKVTQEKVKEARRRKAEKNGSQDGQDAAPRDPGAPIARNIKQVREFIKGLTGPAEKGRDLAKIILAFIEGRISSDKARDGWESFMDS